MRAHVRRTSLAAALAGLAALATVLGAAAPAQSATSGKVSPVKARTSETATTDSLPTAQIGDGVVWSQAIRGGKVYAGGEFTTARPPGAAPGTNEVRRTNLLSYDIRTGQLTGWRPRPNNTVHVLAVSPDHKRLYVGGAFTSIGGASRNRIAAFDIATGKLVARFHPSLNSQVRAIAATNTRVYVGGMFGVANGHPRTRLAAFRASDGALLPWRPSADDLVRSMALTPDESKLVIGGHFTHVNGRVAPGMAAVSSRSSALRPWAATTVVKNGGPGSAILSLRTDGRYMGGFNRWKQHPERGGVDGASAGVDGHADGAAGDEVAGTAADPSGGRAGVLAQDRRGTHLRGRRSRGRRVRAGGSRWFRERGGMPSISLGAPSGRYLSFAEREEIALLKAEGHGVRGIARRIGRAPSTISRELRRNAATRGGELKYRAGVAQWKAELAARRPKPARLVANPRLRDQVQERLAGQVRRRDGTVVAGPAPAPWKGRNKPRRQDRLWALAWSPEQIANRLVWVEDCHGDSYDSYPATYGAVYVVSHAHYCGNVGGFPQTDPWSTNMRRATAFTRRVTGTVQHDHLGYHDFAGQPSPSMINWFPDLAPGSYTGATQAAWTVTGTKRYVVMGGEFPTVNGVGQQGLVRFAVPPRVRPRRGPTDWGKSIAPVLLTPKPGVVLGRFRANSDPDSRWLKYRVIRDRTWSTRSGWSGGPRRSGTAPRCTSPTRA